MNSFTVDENYVITAINVDGVIYHCSLQINADWKPYLQSYIINNDETEISGVMVGDENNGDNWVEDGDCFVANNETWTPNVTVIDAPEVNIVYRGTKYNYIKVWNGTVWLTDRSIGNKLFDTDNDGYLNYTINYLPISLQFVQVNEKDYSVVSTSGVYTATHNGTWAIYDDGHWERLDKAAYSVFDMKDEKNYTASLSD